MAKRKLTLKNSLNLDSAIVSCKTLDIDGDGKEEIIVGTYDNNLRAITWEDNELKEIASTKNPTPITALGVGDMDGDGNFEILTGGRDKQLRLYIKAGKELVEKTSFKFYDLIVDIKMGDVFSNNSNTLIVGAGKFIALFSYYDGELREEGMLRLEREVTKVDICDIDNNDRYDLIFGSRDNHMHLVEYETRFCQTNKAKLKLNYYPLELKVINPNSNKEKIILLSSADGLFMGYEYFAGGWCRE